MRNIILIRPDIDNGYPFGKLPPYVPLGLGFIAGVLKEKGFKVRIIDCYLHKYADAEILDIVEKSDPLFVGISVNVASTQNTYSLTNLLTDKGEYVVLGGPQITVAPEKTLLES
ncbi:MAG TPA: cobalamin B12-binding domain-containing protein [Candidatus Omnitrophota bacterium]|nr:cobalamin B12-binding domain-containing protein [Candidatus Omnitrophota bacterium]